MNYIETEKALESLDILSALTNCSKDELVEPDSQEFIVWTPKTREECEELMKHFTFSYRLKVVGFEYDTREVRTVTRNCITLRSDYDDVMVANRIQLNVLLKGHWNGKTLESVI